MPLSPTGIGHFCERFTERALEQAGLRRPGRLYGYTVTRSDSKDVYEVRVSAVWGQPPDARHRRLMFEVDVHHQGTDAEVARATAHQIEAQVLELEAGCDDVERGGPIRVRPAPRPWHGPVTFSEDALHQHAGETARIMDEGLADFGLRIQQQIFGGGATLKPPPPRPPTRSLWQLLDDL